MLLTVKALYLFPVPLPEKGTAVAEDKSRRESHLSTVELNVTQLIHTKMLSEALKINRKKKLAQIPFDITPINNKNFIQVFHNTVLSSQKLLSLPFERKQLSLVQVTEKGDIKTSMLCEGKTVAYF